jgi:hypothetical protein
MNHARQVFALSQARDEEGLRHRLRRPEGKTSILLKNSSLKITFFEGSDSSMTALAARARNPGAQGQPPSTESFVN